MSPSVYINIVHESEKYQELMVQFQMYFLWDWHVIKHSYNTND